jgi:hypothetical protein
MSEKPVITVRLNEFAKDAEGAIDGLHERGERAVVTRKGRLLALIEPIDLPDTTPEVDEEVETD